LIIKVKGYLTYKDVIGQREIKQPDDVLITLLAFICDLAAEIGGVHGRALFDSELGTIGKSVAIMLNGIHYNHLPERANTVLKDLDEIAVFPPGVGG
jgi:molybdopterin converting factor small subunit